MFQRISLVSVKEEILESKDVREQLRRGPCSHGGEPGWWFRQQWRRMSLVCIKLSEVDCAISISNGRKRKKEQRTTLLREVVTQSKWAPCLLIFKIFT